MPFKLRITLKWELLDNSIINSVNVYSALFVVFVLRYMSHNCSEALMSRLALSILSTLLMPCCRMLSSFWVSLQALRVSDCSNGSRWYRLRREFTVLILVLSTAFLDFSPQLVLHLALYLQPHAQYLYQSIYSYIHMCVCFVTDLFKIFK